MSTRSKIVAYCRKQIGCSYDYIKRMLSPCA